MADKSAIEWTDATWNPIVGCSIVSPGCTNCYAMKMAARIQKMNRTGGSNSDYVNHYDGTTQDSKAGAVWTGKVALAPDKLFLKPLSWKLPRRIFVNSMGDLFHESIPDEWIDRVFAVMELCPQHTFQVLTKRAERMRAYCGSDAALGRVVSLTNSWLQNDGKIEVKHLPDGLRGLTLPNVWLGVSAERQQEADERIPHLLATPAAVRFVSCEPLLGHIALHALNLGTRSPSDALRGQRCVLDDSPAGYHNEPTARLDWVIVGGESGPGARPMEAAWAQSLRDQCAAAGVSFFFKQWGAWVPEGQTLPDGRKVVLRHDDFEYARPGKKGAGRLLDGIEHNAFPEVRA